MSDPTLGTVGTTPPLGKAVENAIPGEPAAAVAPVKPASGLQGEDVLARRRGQYELEKVLARQLMSAFREERRSLYTLVYDTLYTAYPDIHKRIPQRNAASLRYLLQFMKRFAKKDYAVLEIGPGDCSLSFALAAQVRTVYGVDVSEVVTRHSETPENFHLLLSDGTSIPAEPGTVDVAISNQLMEHLHPDDAFDQLSNIYRCLKAGGAYVCITPNRINGPHDIAKLFSDKTQCLHLKEYSATELRHLFRQVGFSRIRLYAGGKGVYVRIPVAVVTVIESALGGLPRRLERKLGNSALFKPLLGIRIVGIK